MGKVLWHGESPSAGAYIGIEMKSGEWVFLLMNASIVLSGLISWLFRAGVRGLKERLSLEPSLCPRHLGVHTSDLNFLWVLA
jgi:hypothetical protein